MKKFTLHSILAAALLLTASCNKWLDVKPKDRTIEEQLYKSEDGFYTALNGVYLELCSQNLYGGQLTMEMLEALAQRYNTSATDHYLRTVTSYSYQESAVKSKVDGIWQGLYKSISNLNRMMLVIDERKNLFASERNYRLLKGQVLGLRAFLHFDLLRLFGPMYNTVDSTSDAIPYYDHYTVEYLPFLPANEVVAKVLADLDEADALLSVSDPVITEGTLFSAAPDGSSNKFRYRNLAMNYYAVQLLKARAELYRGNKTAALEVVKQALPDVEKWFPFVNVNAVTDNINPDKVFSSELLFAQFDARLYEKYNSYYAPALHANSLLTAQASRLNTTYESNENDFRFKSVFWRIPDNNAVTVKCFFKYSDITDKNRPYRQLLPLMRKTELYYIAAECEPSATLAAGYLNTVRKARGLPDLPSNANLTTEIRKEYLKEFYGEGQLFFYYKRNNTTSIPNGSAASGNVAMNASKYVLQIPDSELAYRN